MNKVILIGIIMAMNLAGTAFAADEMVTMDGKNVLLTLVEPKNDVKLHSKDLSNGIFIRVSDSLSPSGGSELPNAGALVKEIFVVHGFKVVDKAEDASVAIQFSSIGGAFKMASANNQAEHGSISADKVVGTVVVGAVGGGAGVLGAVASLFIQTDERTSLLGFVSTKPVHKKPNLVMSSDDNNYNATIISVPTLIEQKQLVG